MAKHNVLSTKSLEPSLVERAKREGINVLEQDAIRVQTIDTTEKKNELFSFFNKKIAYAVFTSSNAVAAVKHYLNKFDGDRPQWKIFSLSGKTKDALATDAALFGTIVATASSAAELAEQAIAHGVTDLLFFCGNRRRDELPTILQNAGVQVHEVTVYEVEETPVAADADYGVVLFFSPSAVQSFFAVNQLKEKAVCFAIGPTTASSVKQFTQNKLYVSKAPTQEALLLEVINYFQNSDCC